MFIIFEVPSDFCFVKVLKNYVYYYMYVPQTIPPNKVCETYCVSSLSYYSYYGSQTKFVRHIVFALFLIIIILPSSASILSGTFLGDALIKLYETLQEYHMPCEVVPLSVDFFQNGCHCHGNSQNAKNFKNTKMIITGYSPNRH